MLVSAAATMLWMFIFLLGKAPLLFLFLMKGSLSTPDGLLAAATLNAFLNSSFSELSEGVTTYYLYSDIVVTANKLKDYKLKYNK